MDSKKQEIIDKIDEDLMILNETLGHFSRLSIYNESRLGFINHTKKDIEYMVDLRDKIKNNHPLPLNKNA